MAIHHLETYVTPTRLSASPTGNEFKFLRVKVTISESFMGAL